MVEAAIIIPVIVLMVISILYLLICFYSGIKAQTEGHEILCNRAMKGNKIFAIENYGTITDGYIGGLIKKRFLRKFDSKCYIINPADGVRLKEGFKNVKE